VPPTDASWRTGLPAGALNVWSEVSIPATCTTTSGSRTLTQFGTRATVHLTGNAQGTIMVTVQSPGLEGSAAFDDTGRAAVSANGDNPHSTSYLRANVRLGAGREIVINSYEQGYSGASDSAGCTQTGEARARF
jgi:hypothetical protein